MTLIKTACTVLLGLGLWAATVQADSLEFATPLPYSKFTQGDLVPIIYKVHHSGMAGLVWAKVHLMTEDGFDAGMGTIATTSRDQWQETLSVATEFRIPDNVPAGKYVFHVYGGTTQPCQGSVDSPQTCERVLSEMVPVEFVERTATLHKQDPSKAKLTANVALRKRQLYSGRDLGLPRSDYLLEDGSEDTKKMLYFFSLI